LGHVVERTSSLNEDSEGIPYTLIAAGAQHAVAVVGTDTFPSTHNSSFISWRQVRKIPILEFVVFTACTFLRLAGKREAVVGWGRCDQGQLGESNITALGYVTVPTPLPLPNVRLYRNYFSVVIFCDFLQMMCTLLGLARILLEPFNTLRVENHIRSF
jgi:hypothetical protein